MYYRIVYIRLLMNYTILKCNAWLVILSTRCSLSHLFSFCNNYEIPSKVIMPSYIFLLLTKLVFGVIIQERNSSNNSTPTIRASTFPLKTVHKKKGKYLPREF